MTADEIVKFLELEPHPKEGGYFRETFRSPANVAVEMLLLHPSSAGEIVKLGKNLAAGERPQVVVPGGVWQGSRLIEGGEVALLGCTVSPGFEYADYEHGRRKELLARFPSHAERIERLTT